MPAYRLDDPALDRAMQDMAAETAAAWPPVSEAQRAALAPILAPPTPPAVKAKPRRRVRVSDRRAA